MNLIPVTDAKKRVTDPVVLSLLARRKIDADYVEFAEDYSRAHPYGKVYRDRASRTRILVSSGLPMVRKTDGSRIVPGFEQSGKNYWIKNNLFDGFVTASGEIHLAAANDQPTGAIEGGEIHMSPVLQIGNEIISPLSVTILPVDPANENYTDNVLEFDYGICRRQIRIIEGRFRGTWIFDKNPRAAIRIRYNRTGKGNIRLGRGYDREWNIVEVRLPVVDEEYVPRTAWPGRTAPVIIGDSMTFYPDANPESVTVDGHIISYGSTTWSYLLAGSGYLSAVDDSSLNVFVGYRSHPSTPGNWERLTRSIFLFNTDVLGLGAIISSAVFSVYGIKKVDETGSSPDINVFTSNPASNISLTGNDFNTFGSTRLSSNISYASFNNAGYNDFSLNGDGLTAIDVSGITKYGTRNVSYDVGATEPAYSGLGQSSQLTGYYADKGTGYKPKLVVTYTTPAYNASGSASASISASGYLRGRQNITGASGASLSVSGFLRGSQSIAGHADASISLSALASFPVAAAGSSDAEITARGTLSGANSETVSGLMGRY
jgi:hypothetical protein